MSTSKDQIQSETELTDEQIIDLEQKMLQEVRGDIPLVSSPVSLDELLQEYQGNSVFSEKIRELSETFSTYRKIRGDGDCFYRTFAYGLLSQHNSDTSSALKASIQVLKDARFEELSYEVFSDILFEVVEKLPGGDLQSIMNNPEESNAVVVYLRFLTSAWIKVSEFYGCALMV
ncbi:Ubiquitin thioesterase otubain-like [Neolecta irregularis DAH-3]|uniref:ubiquitinyl hydrolase 1 n=1 Tax=Neolecta irregularis (strain DAH-3) TaxID=1198029 RepID=A0A1U7LKP3_NEOID|nr:Ubiquitin thioesterase otubain-like [Neolecta irregularis DAH-3]|eukprot:OLL23091.1 Ubiquitin thioesterase otubain-like [Neolecta irregularis DAH-3]